MGFLYVKKMHSIGGGVDDYVSYLYDIQYFISQMSLVRKIPYPK